MNFDFKKETAFKQGDILIIRERDEDRKWTTNPYLIIEDNIGNFGSFKLYDLINLSNSNIKEEYRHLNSDKIHEIIKMITVKQISAEKLYIKETN